MDESTRDTDRAPRRRARWGRWLLGIAVAVVLVVVGSILALLYLSTTGGLSDSALRLTNRLLARSTNLDLAARRVIRTPTGARLEEVSLAIIKDGQRTRVLFAQRLDIVVNVWSLVRGSEQTYVMHLTEPVFTLTFDEKGRPILPEFRTTGEAKQPPRDAIRIVIERGGVFDVKDRRGTTRWWENGTLALLLDPDGKGYLIDLERGGGRLPPLGLVLRSAEGEARTNVPGIALERLRAVTDAGAVTASGAFADSTLRGQLVASDWPWEFFGDLLEQPALSVPGHVDLRARLEGTTRRARFDADLDGRWREEPLAARLAGRLGSDGVVFERARLDWRETSWNGEGAFLRSGDWRFAGRIERLDLERVQRLFPELVLPPSRLGGNAEIAGGSARLRVGGSGISGTVRDLALRDVSGNWRLEGTRNEARAEGGIGGGRARLEGGWNNRTVSLRASGESLDLAEVLRAAGQEIEATGVVRRATATLEGPRTQPRFETEAELLTASASGVSVDSVHARARGTLGGAPDMDVELSALNLSGYGWFADTAEVAGQVMGDRMHFPRIRAVHADTVLTASVQGTRTGKRWQIEAWPAELRTDEWRFAADVPLRITAAPDGIVFEQVELVGDVGRFRLRGRYRDATDLDLYVNADSVDLAPLGRLAKRDLQGQLGGTAHFFAAGPQRHAEFDVRATDLVSEGTRLDSAAASLVADAHGPRLTLKSLRLSVTGGTLAGSGTVTLDEPQWPALPVAWLGKVKQVRSWNGNLETQKFDLALIPAVAPRLRGLTGKASVRLDLGGRPDDPEAEFSGLVKDIAYGGFHFDQGEWRMRLADDRLHVERFELRQQELLYRVTGTAPVPAGVMQAAFAETLVAVPYDLRVEIPNGDLSMLPLLQPLFAAAEGRLHADVRVTGPQDALVVNGTAAVEGARMRVSGREEVYEDINARLRLQDSVIVIESAAARQGKNGRLTGTGRIGLAGGHISYFNIDLKASRATALASGEYVAEFDGDVHVGTGPRIGDAFMPLPSITGTVDVRNAVILYDFADPSNRVYFAGPERAPPWVYNIDVRAPDHVFWRSPASDIEVEAELTVEQQLTYFSVLGTVDTRRGSYYFLGNRFQVDEGHLEFDSVEPMNPLIDATLTTEVPVAATTRGGVTNEEITITLHERARKPEVTITSASNWSESEIFQALTVGRLGLGQEGLSERDRNVLLTATGTQYLVRQLAREFPEQAGLFKDLQIGTAVVGEEEESVVVPSVGLQRYFSSDLLVGYSQLVGGQPSEAADVPLRTLRAEYRLNKIFYLTGEMIEHRMGSSSLPGSQRSEVEYGADVRARHEY